MIFDLNKNTYNQGKPHKKTVLKSLKHTHWNYPPDTNT